MKFLIVLYLTIAMIFSFITPVTSYMAGGTASGVHITSVNEFYNTTQQAAQKLQAKPLGIINFIDQAKSGSTTMLNVMFKMTMFKFTLGSEAPGLVNSFIQDFFGLLSILFILSLLKELSRLVPWIH